MKHGLLALMMAGVSSLLQAAAPDGGLVTDDPIPVFTEMAGRPAPVLCDGQRLHLTILPGGLDVVQGERADSVRVLYRMNFNQVTEGWNWHPEAVRADQDYYQYKFLPLASVDESRGSYRGEDKIGEIQEFGVQWRYDYFFAFDNLYDFFPRAVNDDAGFFAELSVAAGAVVPADQIGMAAEVRLRSPCIADSTTFWKAIYARPVDFTLKKRYLLGDLESVIFYDQRTARVLHRIEKSALVGRR